MTTAYPGALDSFSNPAGSDLLNNVTVALRHSVQHSNTNDAVEALQAKLGIDGSADTGSIDYRVNALEDATAVGLHMLPITAAGMLPAASSGCSALTTIAMGAGQPDVAVLYFDATTTESAHFSIPMPEGWNEGTIQFEALWMHPATTTNFGVAWSLEAVCVSNDDTLAVNFGTAVIVTDTGGTTNDYYRTSRSAAVTAAGTPQSADIMYLKVSRVPSDGGDTLAVDAGLIGLRLYYTNTAAVDS